MTAPLTEERRALCEANLKLARGVARRYRRHYPRLADDFESAAYLGLVVAASTWGRVPGITFEAWAYPRILRAAWGVLDDDRRSRQAPDEADAAVPDRGAPVGSDVDGREAFESRLAPLPPKLREVLRLTYAHGLNRREVAERMGHDQPYVSRLHAKALRSLTPAD